MDVYLGRTYHPRDFHCWTLACEAWRDLTGEDLTDPEARLALVPVPEPISPCIVTLHQLGYATHAGLYRNGRLLHIRPGGVVYERLTDAVRGFAEVHYYASRHSHPGPSRASGRMGAG